MYKLKNKRKKSANVEKSVNSKVTRDNKGI